MKTSPDFEKTYRLPCGTFHFHKSYIISEINEGEYITWERSQELIDLALRHYKTSKPISLISNRQNCYKIKFEDWDKFYSKGLKIKALAIVAYNKNGLMDFMTEKKKFGHKIRNFYSLDKAVKWVSSLN